MSDNWNFENPDKDTNSAYSNSFEDSVIDGLESITAVFDNLYALQNLGIIGKNNFVYRYLNKGNLGSKLWFVTLILSIRKSIIQLYKLIKRKWTLKNEINEDREIYKNISSKTFQCKLQKSLQLDEMIKNILLDAIQSILYLLLVIINVCKIKLPRKLQKALEMASSAVTIWKIIFVNYFSVVM